ncbi:hypothetical protein [Nocardia nepalensis]|uniref:hypothetical protein n=1 Tax=Nocardia nepalensis TaxID=3375448 RepID=UPI003B67889F
MGKNERDKALEYLLDARTGDTTGERPALNEEDAAEVEALIAAVDFVADAVRATDYIPAEEATPPLEEDRVAAMLGLVPDPTYSLDSTALARVRKSAGYSARDLAERLAARGWDISLGDVFRWETRGGPEVSPALIRAIAEETATQPDNLVTDRSTAPENDEVAAVMASTDFQELVARWAESQRTSQALARSTLKARMLTTVHRGEKPDAAQMLHSLAAFIEAYEKGRSR